MKRFLLFATLSMALACSSTLAQSEIEVLRARCEEQERQIRQLEEENSRLRSGEAAPVAPRKPVTEPAASPTTDAVYVVKPGDSWPKIASNTGVRAETLAKLNGLTTSDIIHPGRKLKLPAAATAASAIPATAAPAANTPAAGGRTHKIEQGDTFSSLSRKYGISTATLIAANPNVKPSALRLGQVIQLGDAPTSPAPTSAEVRQAPANPPSAQASAPAEAPRVRSGKPVTVMIEGEITYGDFAAKHGTDVERLNSLNGLDLTHGTVLAKGSELYVPGE